MPDVQTRLLTPVETSEMLGVPEATLTDWRYRRKGPPFIKLGHRLVRYRLDDLEQWLTERRKVAS